MLCIYTSIYRIHVVASFIITGLSWTLFQSDKHKCLVEGPSIECVDNVDVIATLGSARHCPDSIRGIPRTHIEIGGNKQSALENFEDVYIIDPTTKTIIIVTQNHGIFFFQNYTQSDISKRHRR